MTEQRLAPRSAALPKAAFVLGVPIVLAGAGYFLGLPGWVAVGMSAIPGVLLLAPRWGYTLAGVFMMGAGFVATVAIMIASPLIHLDGVAATVVISTLAGLTGTWRFAREIGRLPWSWSAGTVGVLSSFLGALLWWGAMVVARVYPGASAVSWAMLGDSANNVVFAREVLYRGGFGIGGHANPVPLPSGLAALGLGAGREYVAPAGLTEHDVTAYALTWSGLIALCCISFGLFATVMVKRTTTSRLATGAIAASASLLGLTWFVTGYPIEYGFFNAPLTLALLVLAPMAVTRADRHPVPVLATLALLTTASLSVWSPIALWPLGLAVVVLVRSWRAVWGARGRSLALGLGALAQLVAFAMVLPVPTYLSQGSALGNPGGAFGFPHLMVPALAAAAVVLVMLLEWRRSWLLRLGVVAIAVASLAGLGFLLAVSHDPAQRWTYYPLKFAWFTGAALTVVCGALGASLVMRYGHFRAVKSLGVFAVAAATLGVTLYAPTSGAGYVAVNPIERVARGNYFGDGDDLADRIFAMSDLERPQVLWRTSDPSSEGSINFWLLQIQSDSMSENLDLKLLAYGVYDHDDDASLCDIAQAVGEPLLVHTGDPSLEDTMEALCPAAGLSFVVDDGSPVTR